MRYITDIDWVGVWLARMLINKTSKKMKKGKQKKDNKYQLSTDDMKVGFLETGNYQESEYQRQKRKLGVAPGNRILIKWK